MLRTRPIALIALIAPLLACNLPSFAKPLPESSSVIGTPTQANAPGTAASEPTIAAPEKSPLAPPAALSPTALYANLPQEAILILEPGPGSRLTSPAHIAGIADPTFEQNLAVRITLDDGSQLALQTATIQSDAGQPGPFAVDVPFVLSGESQAFIQVFSSSPRDGGLTHVASVGVTLAAEGPANIVPGSPHPETIHILQPALGATISSSVIHVEGFGLASFEQTLDIEVYDAEGGLAASQQAMVQAPQWGKPGAFSAEIACAGAASGPARVVVRDVSPAFGGDVHLSSVEILLQP